MREEMRSEKVRLKCQDGCEAGPDIRHLILLCKPFLFVTSAVPGRPGPTGIAILNCYGKRSSLLGFAPFKRVKNTGWGERTWACFTSKSESMRIFIEPCSLQPQSNPRQLTLASEVASGNAARLVRVVKGKEIQKNNENHMLGQRLANRKQVQAETQANAR